MVASCGVGVWIGPQPALLFPPGFFMAFSLSGGQLRHQAPRRVTICKAPACGDGFEEAIL